MGGTIPGGIQGYSWRGLGGPQWVPRLEPWSASCGQIGLAHCPTVPGLFFLLDQRPDMEFLEVLTEHLDRVMLVRGGGREVITIYS